MTAEPLPPTLHHYEIDAQMLVRRTFIIAARDPDQAIQLAKAHIEISRDGTGAELSSVLKWTDGRHAFRPMPVETIIDTPIAVLDVRQVDYKN